MPVDGDGYGRAMRRRTVLMLGLVGAGCRAGRRRDLAVVLRPRDRRGPGTDPRPERGLREPLRHHGVRGRRHRAAGADDPRHRRRLRPGACVRRAAGRRRLAGRSRRRASATCAPTSPSDPSSENQADAFVDLLDHLGIDRVPIIGGSAGALSAMAFAIRHPDRCAALVALVPAAFAPDRPPPRPPNALAAGHHRLRPALGLPVLARHDDGRGRDDRHVARHRSRRWCTRASPAEQARVRAILHDILPVSDRARGLHQRRQARRLAGADGARGHPGADARALARGRPLRDPGRRAPHRGDRSPARS